MAIAKGEGGEGGCPLFALDIFLGLGHRFSEISICCSVCADFYKPSRPKIPHPGSKDGNLLQLICIGCCNLSVLAIYISPSTRNNFETFLCNRPAGTVTGTARRTLETCQGSVGIGHMLPLLKFGKSS